MNKASPIPLPLDPDALLTAECEPMTPWPPTIRNDEYKHGARLLFAGEFTSYLYTSDAGLMRFEDYPFDEYVTVLAGTATLTPDGGEPGVFATGKSFIVPKGFTGTWEVTAGYRELFVIESVSCEAGFKVLGLA